MLADAGIIEQQQQVLRAPGEFGPLETSKLAELAYLLLPIQSRIVQTFLDKGLIACLPAVNDWRKKIIAITSGGRQIIDLSPKPGRGLARSRFRRRSSPLTE